MITSLYGALLAIVFVVLSARVIRTRRSARIPLGDAGDATMQRVMRVHANFAEYVPLTLVLIALAEISEAPHWLIHLTGAALVAGRAVHAFGISREPENYQLREVGMVLTFVSLMSAATAGLGTYLV